MMREQCSLLEGWCDAHVAADARTLKSTSVSPSVRGTSASHEACQQRRKTMIRSRLAAPTRTMRRTEVQGPPRSPQGPPTTRTKTPACIVAYLIHNLRTIRLLFSARAHVGLSVLTVPDSVTKCTRTMLQADNARVSAQARLTCCCTPTAPGRGGRGPGRNQQRRGVSGARAVTHPHMSFIKVLHRVSPGRMEGM